MLTAIFALVFVCCVSAYFIWKNHSTGWAHLRSGPFAERKSQPILYWGCQIFYLVPIAIAVIWVCLVAFGSG
ncbi:MAG: hypothetical protein IPL62_07595 [Caulobacteraceae bacterium]|jgi:hypothetical protein|nr:hypothetical protein [Caulobacteraceae bacterium]MBK8543439.1 hypothetical protein [Caulobacteraceae bacterium]